jgi:hypothetical protein
MFCPKCGMADQQPETYCRQCGVFLPDLSKPFKAESPPEENLKVNSVLSLMSVIVSFTLAILLYALLGFRADTHLMIYITAGFLLAIGGWQIQTFIRTRRLREQWTRGSRQTDAVGETAEPQFRSPSTAKLLEQPDLSSSIPASVTENTTRQLSETKVRSS